MRSTRFFLIFFSALVLLVTACDPEMPPPGPTETTYGPGLYIVNEGPFVSGTGTVSYLPTGTDSVEQAIFQAANEGDVLGNIAQSLTLHSTGTYVVVNNANVVRVVNDLTFREEGTISGLSLPRYMTMYDSNTGFISQWGATGTNGSVAVVDLTTRTITDTIATGAGPEEMIQVNDKLYVVNSGGFGRDSTLVIINPVTGDIENTVVVGANPVSVVSDGVGDIWTLGRGHYENFADPDDPANIPGKLCRINSDGSVIECIDVPIGAENLVIGFNDIDLFFTAEGKIWQYTTVGNQTEPAIFYEGFFYALYWDDFNQELLAADAGDFSAPGRILRLNGNGEEAGEYAAGVVPTFMIRK